MSVIHRICLLASILVLAVACESNQGEANHVSATQLKLTAMQDNANYTVELSIFDAVGHTQLTILNKQSDPAESIKFALNPPATVGEVLVLSKAMAIGELNENNELPIYLVHTKSPNDGRMVVVEWLAGLAGKLRMGRVYPVPIIRPLTTSSLAVSSNMRELHYNIPGTLDNPDTPAHIVYNIDQHSQATKPLRIQLPRK